jgi:hypothetical protein
VRIISARKATNNEQQSYQRRPIMKDEYDFTNAEQGKFYRPLEELDIPVYLDKEVKEYFIQKIRSKGNQFSLNETINSLLKKDIEISKKLAG